MFSEMFGKQDTKITVRFVLLRFSIAELGPQLVIQDLTVAHSFSQEIEGRLVCYWTAFKSVKFNVGIQEQYILFYSIVTLFRYFMKRRTSNGDILLLLVFDYTLMVACGKYLRTLVLFNQHVTFLQEYHVLIVQA